MEDREWMASLLADQARELERLAERSRELRLKAREARAVASAARDRALALEQYRTGRAESRQPPVPTHWP